MADLKPCYAVEAFYVEGAANKREPYRQEHLERVTKLLAEGALIVAGGFEDMRSALLVFDVESEEAARVTIESDVYWREGIWIDYAVRKLNRVV
jgi:uncharacterized protein YciI